MKTEKACVTLDDFTGLYQKFGPMVLRRCMYLLKNEEKAYDAMQDVFVRVIERRTELSTVCSSFFYTVATRVCLNRIRSDRLRDCPSLDNLVTEIQDNVSVNHEDVADSAALLERIFKEELGYINILLPECDVLLSLNNGDLYLTAYNIDGESKELLSSLAISEGLFFYPKPSYGSDNG